jgi:hypothetical protein
VKPKKDNMITTSVEYSISVYSDDPNLRPTILSAKSYQDAVDQIRKRVEIGNGHKVGESQTYDFQSADGKTLYRQSFEIWEKEIITETRSIEISFYL